MGERARVYVTTGKRNAILAPKSAVYRRAGVDFVKLADGAEVVVQTGDSHGAAVEILSGLHDGDVVQTP